MTSVTVITNPDMVATITPSIIATINISADTDYSCAISTDDSEYLARVYANKVYETVLNTSTATAETVTQAESASFSGSFPTTG